MKIFTSLLFCILSIITYSQSISLTTADSLHLVEENIDINEDFSHKTYVESEVFSSAEVKWTIDSLFFPSDWDLSICDNETCIGVSDLTATNTFTLAANATGELKMGYIPNGVSGNAYIRVASKVEGTSDEELMMIFTAKIDANIESAISNISNESNFSIYPNPTKGDLFFSQESESDIEKIEIFNVIGKKIFETNVVNLITQISINNLDNGMYIAKVFSKNNNLISTQTFVKK